MNVDVAIVGAGVSGLTAAHRLSLRGHEVMVLERQARLGGNAISERADGFLMEHGPSAINATLPHAAELSAALGIEDEVVDLGDAVRRRYIVDGGLRGIAVHPFGILTSRLLTPLGRLRLLAEPLLPRRRDEGDETVAAFWSRRFGREFERKLVEPLAGGMFAGVGNDLSMRALFPALLQMEREDGSVTVGIIKRRMANRQMPARRLISWRDGVAALPAALARSLGGAVRTGATVRTITAEAGGYRIELARDGVVHARTVLLATQSHVAGMLLEELDGAAAEACHGIEAPPLATMFLGYRRGQVAHPLDGLGYLAVPGQGARMLTGAQFCSTMFPGRAPKGHVALAGYVGGDRSPDLARLPADDLIALAREEFGDLLGASGQPVVARVRQWDRGLPQFRPGHGQRTTVLGELPNRRPGLFLTGNYLGGPSVSACLAGAYRAAKSIDAYLAGLPAEAVLETRSQREDEKGG
ncbi:MAG: protoporphyrinogen oxidase [Alphaproteobacteria bacterium]|nr:protoporphyrinogen oxidase [Alphaproteobacteria bacterium]